MRIVRSVNVLMIVTRTRRLCKFPSFLALPSFFFLLRFCAPRSYLILPFISSLDSFFPLCSRQCSNEICCLPIYNSPLCWLKYMIHISYHILLVVYFFYYSKHLPPTTVLKDIRKKKTQDTPKDHSGYLKIPTTCPQSIPSRSRSVLGVQIDPSRCHIDLFGESNLFLFIIVDHILVLDKQITQ